MSLVCFVVQFDCGLNCFKTNKIGMVLPQEVLWVVQRFYPKAQSRYLHQKPK